MLYCSTLLEEVGSNLNITLAVEVEADGNEAEPATYEYPGCDAWVEITAIKVTTFRSGSTVVCRDERPDWFAWLDKVVFEKFYNDESLIERLVEANNSEDDYADRMYDAWKDEKASA